MRRDFVLAVTATFILGAALAAKAQTAPPIKPGLWQVHMEREVNGQKVPDASERLKNLSPEKRAQFEAMMKQHGMATSAGGPNQVCYTKEALARSPWADMQTDCKPVFSVQSSSSWKWHTTCPKSGYEADGEASFLDHENYTVKSTSASKIGDTVRNSTTTITAKWWGPIVAVKPFDPKP